MLKLEDVIKEFKRPVLVDENGCWNWLGSISSQGYALYNNKPVHALLSRKLGKPCNLDKVFRHTCANKRCINPDHVVEGTYSENLIDSILDGSRGPIRERYAKMVELSKTGMIQADIARELNVSRGLVSQFFLRKIMCFKPEDFIGGEDAELG
jgi:hypothetical protein